MSRSSTKAEYHALATTVVELSWLRILFKELCMFLSHVPMIWCDNVYAFALFANPVFHSRTKHLEVYYHFTCEKVIRKQLQIGLFLAGTTLRMCLTNHSLLLFFIFIMPNF